MAAEATAETFFSVFIEPFLSFFFIYTISLNDIIYPPFCFFSADSIWACLALRFKFGNLRHTQLYNRKVLNRLILRELLLLAMIRFYCQYADRDMKSLNTATSSSTHRFLPFLTPPICSCNVPCSCSTISSSRRSLICLRDRYPSSVSEFTPLSSGKLRRIETLTSRLPGESNIRHRDGGARDALLRSAINVVVPEQS